MATHGRVARGGVGLCALSCGPDGLAYSGVGSGTVSRGPVRQGMVTSGSAARLRSGRPRFGAVRQGEAQFAPAACGEQGYVGLGSLAFRPAR